MRILFCAWRDLANPLAGGSEVLIDHLAAGLTDRGHDVTLLCGGPVGARPYRVVRSGGTYSQYLRAPGHYLREFRDADLVVDVANGMPFLAPLWRRGPSVCFVNHVHTTQWNCWFPPVAAAVGRTIEGRVMPAVYRNRLFIAVSPSTAASLEGIGVAPEQIRFVPNGVEQAATAAETSAEPVFLVLGRLVPHKRVDLLLRVWDRVRPQIGGRLVVAGSGPEHDRLVAMAGPSVEFVGQVSEDEKARLLAEAWLLVHPSMLEGWGLVVMEAAAVGTPTLGFAVPGVRDSVVDGVSGVLVDSADDLAREWVDLATNPARRTALSLGAREVAAHYSWSRSVDAFLLVADEAVARHARVPAPTPVPVAPVLTRPRARLVPQAPGLARPSVSIVVPAFNEAHRLGRSIPELLDSVAGLDAELILVDDGSTDGTEGIAAKLFGQDDERFVLKLPAHRGKGAAVRAGVARARGDAIVFMDADLATDLAHLPEVIDALDENHVVVGSRAAPGATTEGASATRAHLGRTFNRLARTATGMSVLDFQCGFKAFRAPVAKMLFHLSELDGFAFDVEILLLASRIGYRIAEIPVRWEAKAGGHVRLSRDAPAMALDVLRARMRLTSRHTLASIEASGESPSAAQEAVTALGPHLRVFDSVVPWHNGALGLLPFLDAQAAEEIAARVQREMPRFVVHASTLPTWELLAPSAAALRDALAAA